MRGAGWAIMIIVSAFGMIFGSIAHIFSIKGKKPKYVLDFDTPPTTEEYYTRLAQDKYFEEWKDYYKYAGYRRYNLFQNMNKKHYKYHTQPPRWHTNNHHCSY